MEKYTLELSDLVSNLFLIVMENNNEINSVTYKQIRDFRKILEEEAEKRDIKLSFLLSREYAANFFHYEAATFNKENEFTISLKDGVTPAHLIYQYRTHLPVGMTVLMIDDNVVNNTLNMMGFERSKEKATIDLKFYIGKLKSMIQEEANSMNFEKCIELREKLYELQHINSILTEDEDKQPKSNIKRILEEEARQFYVDEDGLVKQKKKRLGN